MMALSTFVPTTADHQVKLIKQPPAWDRGLSNYLIDLTTHLKEMDY